MGSKGQDSNLQERCLHVYIHLNYDRIELLLCIKIKSKNFWKSEHITQK